MGILSLLGFQNAGNAPRVETWVPKDSFIMHAEQATWVRTVTEAERQDFKSVLEQNFAGAAAITRQDALQGVFDSVSYLFHERQRQGELKIAPGPKEIAAITQNIVTESRAFPSM